MIEELQKIEIMKTPYEIIEKNKLIAEFMGLIRSDEPVDGLGHGKHWWFYKKPFLWDERVCNDEELNYHKSWDWLMPVIEKIEKKYDNEFILKLHDYYVNSDSKLEDIWMTVTEFIITIKYNPNL